MKKKSVGAILIGCSIVLIIVGLVLISRNQKEVVSVVPVPKKETTYPYMVPRFLISAIGDRIDAYYRCHCSMMYMRAPARIAFSHSPSLESLLRSSKSLALSISGGSTFFLGLISLMGLLSLWRRIFALLDRGDSVSDVADKLKIDLTLAWALRAMMTL